MTCLQLQLSEGESGLPPCQVAGAPCHPGPFHLCGGKPLPASAFASPVLRAGKALPSGLLVRSAVAAPKCGPIV